MHRPLTAVASLVGEHGLYGASVAAAPRLWGTDSVFVVHKLSCSEACGVFPHQGSNPCLLHWQADSDHWATREARSLILYKTSILLSMKRCCVFNGNCFRSSRLIFKD